MLFSRIQLSLIRLELLYFISDIYTLNLCTPIEYCYCAACSVYQLANIIVQWPVCNMLLIDDVEYHLLLY